MSEDSLRPIGAYAPVGGQKTESGLTLQGATGDKSGR